MPTYERRYYLKLLIDENTKRNESVREQTTSTGKGTRTRRVSGDTLKSKLKSGEIPNQ
tara:strand:+ start:31467 stop:31640 length:174 start_codon:yes stop_codon:yes gene_type:complete